MKQDKGASQSDRAVVNGTEQVVSAVPASVPCAGDEDAWRYPNLWRLQSIIAERIANGQKWTWFERGAGGWYVGLGPFTDFLPLWPVDCDDEAFVVTLIEVLNGHQVAGRDSPPQITPDAIAALKARESQQ